MIFEYRNRLVKQRIDKFDEMKRDMGVAHFPNTYKKDTDISTFMEAYLDKSQEELSEIETVHRMAGRIMAMRTFGKASFIHFQDSTGRL